MNKRRRNGAFHVYFLMRVTLWLILYLITLHAWQRRMNALLMIFMILWILSKYPFLIKLMLSLVAMMPLWMKLCLWIMNNMLYVMLILLSFFMMLLKIILKEEYLVVGIFMLLQHLSSCWRFWSCSWFTFLCMLLCASLICFFTIFLFIGSGLGLNVFHILLFMLSFDSTLILMWASYKIIMPS